MTGPPFPRPIAGSNAIGRFKIGVSPIGTISPFDVWQTVLAQYANSPILTQLITDFLQVIDTTELFDEYYDVVFNLVTAQGFGLDIWGRILGVSRVLNVGQGGPFFGFSQGQPGTEPWGQGTWFSSGSGSTTTNFALADEPYRILLFAKAAANISDGSIKSINAILMRLFPGRGNAYVLDGLNMTMEYVFTFTLTPVELAIVGQSGVLPKPAGVFASVVQV